MSSEDKFNVENLERIVKDGAWFVVDGSGRSDSLSEDYWGVCREFSIRLSRKESADGKFSECSIVAKRQGEVVYEHSQRTYFVQGDSTMENLFRLVRSSYKGEIKEPEMTDSENRTQEA